MTGLGYALGDSVQVRFRMYKKPCGELYLRLLAPDPASLNALDHDWIAADAATYYDDKCYCEGRENKYRSQ